MCPGGTCARAASGRCRAAAVCAAALLWGCRCAVGAAALLWGVPQLYSKPTAGATLGKRAGWRGAIALGKRAGARVDVGEGEKKPADV